MDARAVGHQAMRMIERLEGFGDEGKVEAVIIIVETSDETVDFVTTDGTSGTIGLLDQAHRLARQGITYADDE